MKIPAETHSDDHVFEVPFDAAPWFDQATNEQILDLAKIEWGGNLAADRVAEFFNDKPGYERVTDMFLHLTRAPKMGRDTVGFECHVDEHAALRWIVDNRPSLFPEKIADALKTDVDDVMERVRDISPAP